MLCPVIFRLQSTFTDSCYHQQEVVDPGIHRNTDPYWLYWDKRKSLNIYLEFLCHPLEPSNTRSFPIKPNVSWVQVNIGAVKLYRCNRSAMLCKIYVSAQNRSTFFKEVNLDMGVSKNSGTPKSSILIGFSIINHPFWGTPIFGNTHMHPSGSVPRHGGPPLYSDRRTDFAAGDRGTTRAQNLCPAGLMCDEGVICLRFWKFWNSLRIHVWYIYLHLVDFYGKCR